MKRLIVALFILGVSAVAVLAQPKTFGINRLVLRITEVEVSTFGAPIRFKLESGEWLTVPFTAVDFEQSQKVGMEALTAAPAVPATAAPTTAPVPDIRAKCAKEWPDDFSMRAYCEKQQQDSRTKLNGRPMTTPDQRTIRDKCAKDWPDDFAMRNYCEEQQLKALGSLR